MRSQIFHNWTCASGKFVLSSPAVYAETYYVMRIVLPFEIWLLGIGIIKIRIGKNTGI